MRQKHNIQENENDRILHEGRSMLIILLLISHECRLGGLFIHISETAYKYREICLRTCCGWMKTVLEYTAVKRNNVI